jgi:hypothetical protein
VYVQSIVKHTNYPDLVTMPVYLFVPASAESL